MPGSVHLCFGLVLSDGFTLANLLVGIWLTSYTEEAPHPPGHVQASLPPTEPPRPSMCHGTDVIKWS